MTIVRLLFVPLAAFVAGCRLAPAPVLERFPIGMYDVRTPLEIERLAAAGFDTVLVSGRRQDIAPLAAEARRRRIRVIAWHRAVMEDGRPPEDWPLDAWYVFDEPDVAKLSSAALSGLVAGVKSWDAGTPAVFTIGQGKAAETYGGIGDAMMLDWYPVPHLPLDSVADEMDKAFGRVRGKPLWFVVQSFDWRDWPQRGKRKIGRYPTRAEMRFMSYLAVMHGARGLFYYTMRRSNGGSLLDHPEQWQATAKVAGEIRAMQPIWSRNERRPLPFEVRTDGFEAACWRWRGKEYLVLLNRTGDRRLKVPAALLDLSWRPLFEARRDPKGLLYSAHGAWYLNPRQVLVLEGRVRPGR